MASPPIAAPRHPIEPDSGYLLQLKAKRITGRVLTYAALLLVCAVIGAPMFWMLTAAFKSNPEVYTFPPIWNVILGATLIGLNVLQSVTKSIVEAVRTIGSKW